MANSIWRDNVNDVNRYNPSVAAFNLVHVSSKSLRRVSSVASRSARSFAISVCIFWTCQLIKTKNDLINFDILVCWNVRTTETKVLTDVKILKSLSEIKYIMKRMKLRQIPRLPSFSAWPPQLPLELLFLRKPETNFLKFQR